MHEAPRAGNKAFTSRHREPIAIWAKLSRGETISLYKGPEFIASGKIDMLAGDGSLLWIIQDEGRGRSLFLREDDFIIVRGKPTL
jgi:hypothetical protein